MNSWYAVGEVMVKLSDQEIELIEQGKCLEGKIWVTPESKEYPLKVYITKGSYWNARTVDKGKSYIVGIPPEGISLLKDIGCICGEMLARGVNFRKVRVEKDSVI